VKLGVTVVNLMIEINAKDVKQAITEKKERISAQSVIVLLMDII